MGSPRRPETPAENAMPRGPISVAVRPTIHRGASLPLIGGFQKSTPFREIQAPVEVGGRFWNSCKDGSSGGGTVTGAVTVCASPIAGASTQANSAIVAVTRITLNFRRRPRRAGLFGSPRAAAANRVAPQAVPGSKVAAMEPRGHQPTCECFRCRPPQMQHRPWCACRSCRPPRSVLDDPGR
jgi:hypothetical protein